MNNTSGQSPSINTSKSFSKQTLRLLLFVAALAAGSLAHADIFVKTNNTLALNLAGSWTNNAIPGTNDIARWDNTVSAANTAATLGGNMAVEGISIVDPGATVTIAAGNTLTNGAAGIDMTAAIADLTLNNTMFIAPGALQQWNVAPGRTLTVAAVPTKPGQPNNNTGALQVGNTGGTVRFGVAASAIITDNQGNPWVTYGSNDWAALDGSGTVIPVSYASASTAFTAGANNDVQGSFNNGTTSIDISSLRFDSSTPYTVAISTSSTSRTLTGRGILVTANCGGGTLGGTATSSFLRPSRTTIANTSFNVIQNSPNDFTIAANISNGSSSAPTHLVKSGPGNLIVSNPGNGYTGGTDVDGGTLTLAAGGSVGGGNVVVNSGRLVINASNTTFIASATINNGATNSIKVNNANAQQYIPAVTFGAGATHLEVNYANGILPSTTIAPLQISNLTANGSIALDVYNNNLTPGVYPLVRYTNTFGGAGFSAFNLGFLPSRVTGYLSNDTTAAVIDLVVTNVNQPITWAVGNADWDINNSLNWKDTFGTSVKYQQATTPYSSLGDAVVFDNTASGSSPIAVNLTTDVSPASITANGAKSYTISGSGTINGTGGLTKSGSGTLTLGTVNSFTGAVNLNGGTVAFSALTNLGGGPINFNGGSLSYTNGNGDDISVRTVTFGIGGATIDDGGSFVLLNNPIGNSGPGNFTKLGAGTLELNGTNRYTGNTFVSGGTLMLGANTYISNSPVLTVNATLDTGTVGTQLALNPSVNQILCGTGTVTGNVTVPAGTTVSPATNGVAGTLTLNNDLTLNGGTLAFDVSNTGHDLINVGGSLTINSGSVLVITNLAPLNNGTYKLIQYSGGLNSGSGSSANLTIQGFSQPGKVAALSDANSGEIDLVITTQGGASTTWLGNDPNTPGAWDIQTTKNFANASHTAVTFVQGDKPTFDDSSSVPTVNLMAAVQPGSVTVNATNNSYVFQDGSGTGAGKLTGTGGITKNGPSTLSILTVNNNSGPTVINGGTVQVGNGSQNGDIGTGNITDNGTLLFQQVDNRSIAGQITGTGSLTQQGSATLTLAQDNSYSGATTISSGALQVGNGGNAGSLSTGAVTDNGTLSFNRTGTVTVPNNISGSGALANLGASTMTFSGPLAYLGNTFVSNGVVRLAGPNQIPNANNVAGSTGWLILDGSAGVFGTLDLNGFDQAVNALSGLGGTFTGVITNSGTVATTTNVLTVLGEAGTTFNGVIADNAAGSKTMLVLRGANELRLNGANTYSGGTLVGDSATIGIGLNASLGSGTLVMSNGTTFSIHNQGGNSTFLTANVFIPDNATITNFSTSLGNGYAGVITGSATTTNIISASSGQGFSYLARQPEAIAAIPRNPDRSFWPIPALVRQQRAQ